MEFADDPHTAADLLFGPCLIPGCPTGSFPSGTEDKKPAPPIWWQA